MRGIIASNALISAFMLRRLVFNVEETYHADGHAHIRLVESKHVGKTGTRSDQSVIVGIAYEIGFDDPM